MNKSRKVASRSNHRGLSFSQWFREVKTWYKTLDPLYNLSDSPIGWEGYYRNGLSAEEAVRQDIDSGA